MIFKQSTLSCAIFRIGLRATHVVLGATGGYQHHIGDPCNIMISYKYYIELIIQHETAHAVHLYLD